MINGQIQETPTKSSNSQCTQEGTNSTVILARVYALILSWPEQTDAETAQGIEEGTTESHLESREPGTAEVTASTLTTE